MRNKCYSRAVSRMSEASSSGFRAGDSTVHREFGSSSSAYRLVRNVCLSRAVTSASDSSSSDTNFLLNSTYNLCALSSLSTNDMQY